MFAQALPVANLETLGTCGSGLNVVDEHPPHLTVLMRAELALVTHVVAAGAFVLQMVN
jgi:hypothetical protein